MNRVTLKLENEFTMINAHIFRQYLSNFIYFIKKVKHMNRFNNNFAKRNIREYFYAKLRKFFSCKYGVNP